MLQYVIAGLVLGGIYAIASAGLVVTYLSAGILNFAFGAFAFFVARFYYFLNSQHGWPILPSAALSLLVVAPLLGVLFYYGLFRHLRLSPALIKVVATLGLSVALPAAATLMFGSQQILTAPGLAPEPVRTFQFFGVPVTLDQIIVYGCVLVVVVAGALILRYSDVGLRVRAMVDSPAMTSLSGTNPSSVSIGVWAASTFLAGLAGVLSAPIIGLNASAYTLLMASAFAAVIAAKLRNLPIAVIVGLVMGIAGAVIPSYLSPSSPWTAAVIPSIPFVVTALFLAYYLSRRSGVNEEEGVGGALDRAIAVHGDARVGAAIDNPAKAGTRALGWGPSIAGVVFVGALPWILHGLWVGLLAQGIAFGVLFLSFTLVTGEGGMVWLCMVTFGGVGGMTAAYLAASHGWPILAAVAAGGVVALPMGAIIGLLTIKLGNLYVALVTLTFGLLMENLVFSRNIFTNNGIGVNIGRPQFAGGDRALSYLMLAIFIVVAVLIVNIRKSTTGLALGAMRASTAGSKTIGMSVLQMKVIIAALAAFVAGVGGAALAVADGVALPSNYATIAGVVWLAVLVTQGIRSITAALIAGLTFTLASGFTQIYLPTWTSNVLPVLFGLGAIGVAKFPDGLIVEQARQLRTVGSWLRRHAPAFSGSGPVTEPTS